MKQPSKPMPGPHNKGGYNVFIADDGAILVKPGDSLSKYSKAMYGDFEHIYEFARRVPAGTGPLQSIPRDKVDYIQAHETIYHFPTATQWNRSDSGTDLSKLPSGEYDIQRIISENNLDPKSYSALTWLLNGGKLLQAGGAAVSIFAAEGTVSAFFGTANPACGAVLGIVGSVLALWDAASYSIKQVVMRGVTYGTVAWAFDYAPPVLPKAIEKNIGSIQPAHLERYKTEWNRSVRAAMNKLAAYQNKEGLQKEDMQALIQSQVLRYGNLKDPTREPGPQWLAAALLIEAADKYASDGVLLWGREMDRTNFLQPWSWYPHDRSIGRPNYPALISNRYPY